MEDKLNKLKSLTYQIKTESYQRIGHRVIQIGHNMLVFGGVNNQNQFATNIFRINSETMAGDLIVTKTLLKLQDFSLFSFKEHIYLWGGSDQTGPSNKLYKFIGEDYQIIAQQGDVPSPRSRHASFFFMKKYLIIQGGTNGEEFFKDFHLLDCSSMHWSKVLPNLDIPYCLNSFICWNGGRGFLMLNESFCFKERKINYENIIFEFRFTDSKSNRISIERVNVTESGGKPVESKREVSVAFLSYQSPYLMVIGGETIPFNGLEEETNQTFSYRDIWFFNLQTLEWCSTSFKLLTSYYGFQVIFYQERLYLIGGVSLSTRDLSFTPIEVVDINPDCLEARLCKVCRQLYGFRDYSNSERQFSIKFEHQQHQRTFFTTKTIAKMSKFIKHPFSAISLLLDNIINLNGTLINIQFKYFDKCQLQTPVDSGCLLDKTADNKLKMRYNYIQISDDTCGFTQSQIMESLYSFGIKTQKLTTDKKYEEELQIRKEFGVNIKLGSLRIAQSCLIVTKTLDEYIFVCYFTSLETLGQKFQILSYYLTGSQRSSEINFQSIKENVGGHIPQDYEHLQGKTKTKVYLFNLPREQLVKEVIDFNTYDITYRQSSCATLQHLKLYLQSLYFTPYTGRIIKIEGQELKFKNYLQIFKKDEQEKIITRLNMSLQQGFFKQYAFYKYHSPKYPIKEILVYHQNRFLYPIETHASNLCGFVVIPPSINVDLCKTKIQNHNEQHIFHRFIQKVISNANQYLPSAFDTLHKLVKN